MNWTPPLNLMRLAGLLATAAALVGCAGAGEMTPQQREGVEMRRYCEQNPWDTERCLGFLGWR